MAQHEMHHADYGTGQKKLSIYVIGVISCAILTLIAFGAAPSDLFTKWQKFLIIFGAATIQLFVQVICFLRLNAETPQGKMNLLSLLSTLIIIVFLLIGSLWIMGNTHYRMMF